MSYYGQITGTDNGVEGTWLVELKDDRVPVDNFTFIPVETLPDLVPVWTVELPTGSEAEMEFSDDGMADIGYMVMRRRMTELKGLDAGN